MNVTEHDMDTIFAIRQYRAGAAWAFGHGDILPVSYPEVVQPPIIRKFFVWLDICHQQMFTSQSEWIWKFIIEWLSLHELVHLLLRPNVEGDVRNNKVVVRVDVWTTWFVNQAHYTPLYYVIKKLLCITVDEVKIDIAQCKPGSKAVKIRTKHLWNSNQSLRQNDHQMPNIVAQLIKKHLDHS